VFETLLIFFAFVIWIWLLFVVFGDLFSRRDISGWVKVVWIALIIVFPYLGVFVYLIAQHKGMTERTIARQEAAKGEFDTYVQSVAAQQSPADQIARAKQLLDEGAIDGAEFERIKTKALAT
jgi:hypothetical protein